MNEFAIYASGIALCVGIGIVVIRIKNGAYGWALATAAFAGLNLATLITNTIAFIATLG
jgi:hypothetical protein